MHKLIVETPFVTELGAFIQNLQIGYWTTGSMNDDRSNVIWICHALTANADASDWWSGLVGKDKAIDPDKYFIVCANMIGSCYGSTSPYSSNGFNEISYGLDFPLITVRDIVTSHRILADHLGLGKIHMILGGSLGGQQSLEWAVQEPDRFDFLVPMACNAQHSPWGIAFNEAQRMALKSDPGFFKDGLSVEGLEAARAIALLSYRNARTFNTTQADLHVNPFEYNSVSYLHYQGKKLSRRFKAWSYWSLSRTMDSHNVGRERGGSETALKQIRAKTFVVGISTDLLFPIEEQAFLTQHIPGSILCVLDSAYGHDGFLIEYPFLDQLIRQILTEN